MPEVEDVLTTEELDVLLWRSAQAIPCLRSCGILPGWKVGRTWRFRRSGLVGSVHGGRDQGVSVS